MISTPFRSKILTHTRSISLPTRSHPLIPQFNDHLQRLMQPCDSSTPSSLPSITKNLINLEHMYNCVDDLLILPHTHKVFAQEFNEKWVEETLEGYLRLVDACATANDFVFQAKLDVQGLLSILRRRREVEDLCGFLNSRRHTKKMIQKSLRSFKNKASTVFALDYYKDQETIGVISMLREAESVTFDLIEVLLSSISGTTKTKGWSLVSRLIKSRKNSGNIHSHYYTPEFEELDEILYKIFCNRASKGDDSGVEIVDDLMHQLREMDSRIQVVEERLECLFKRLIKTRVSLLNMQS